MQFLIFSISNDSIDSLISCFGEGFRLSINVLSRSFLYFAFNIEKTDSIGLNWGQYAILKTGIILRSSYAYFDRRE